MGTRGPHQSKQSKILRCFTDETVRRWSSEICCRLCHEEVECGAVTFGWSYERVRAYEHKTSTRLLGLTENRGAYEYERLSIMLRPYRRHRSWKDGRPESIESYIERLFTIIRFLPAIKPAHETDIEKLTRRWRPTPPRSTDKRGSEWIRRYARASENKEFFRTRSKWDRLDIQIAEARRGHRPPPENVEAKKKIINYRDLSSDQLRALWAWQDQDIDAKRQKVLQCDPIDEIELDEFLDHYRG